ncbi:biliverdin-producing heme oxygenase [Goekera deserti]|uniref:biliverdin-producing heme oxygenase n=1 Tax=Goekera deserti TaxID=2497753 RepID=UPI001F353E0A|nr:biliverdin-producing heme oxygenase [Goekera deserti]
MLRRLRTATAVEHRQVEDGLALTDPELTTDRLVSVLRGMHGFWCAAEDGLDAWFGTDPGAAARLQWSRRRRAYLFAADLRILGAEPAGTRPRLDAVTGPEQALGRMYVLEGSTLGGTFIDRHLATLPHLAPAGSLRAFTPYGEDTGALWAAYRRATRDAVAAGADPDAVVDAARRTFRALSAWCAPVGAHGEPG